MVRKWHFVDDKNRIEWMNRPQLSQSVSQSASINETHSEWSKDLEISTTVVVSPEKGWRTKMNVNYCCFVRDTFSFVIVPIRSCRQKVTFLRECVSQIVNSKQKLTLAKFGWLILIPRELEKNFQSRALLYQQFSTTHRRWHRQRKFFYANGGFIEIFSIVLWDWEEIWNFHFAFVLTKEFFFINVSVTGRILSI